MPLFEETTLYGYFDKWFDYLSQRHFHLTGYVIMPNHFHGLIYVSPEASVSLNRLIGNAKRFLAYEIVTRLKQQDRETLLDRLAGQVTEKERKKGKQHQVFRLSFDAKLCFSRKMVEEKLMYIHRNPVSGKWKLVEDWVDYQYSSAAFYEKGTEHPYLVHYMQILGL